MEPITTLNTLHIVATALLLISALVLASGVVKVRLEGDTTVQNRLLKRPLLFFWV
ncbi:membrane protein, partial [Pseudomonas syringae pv. syringae FF5]